MPKRKSNKVDSIDDLVNELETAHETIKEEINETPPQGKQPELDSKPQYDTDKKRDELLKLAEDGELDKSVAFVKKASSKIVDKLYGKYDRKRSQKANEFLTDLLISKFSSTLGGLDAIDSPDTLTNDLKKDELLKRDVYRLVETISPFIPYLGILSGGATVAKHVYEHKTKPQDIDPKLEPPTESQ